MSFVPASSGVRLDVPEHGRRRHGVAGRIAREDRGEIEPEAVNMHLADPIAQAIDNHPANNGMIGVERVTTPAVVGITSRGLCSSM